MPNLASGTVDCQSTFALCLANERCAAQDTTVRRKDGGEAGPQDGEDGGGSAAMAGRRTLDSLGAADSVIDAMDLAAAETDRLVAAASAGGAKAASTVPNPLMLGLTPAAYVLRAVQVTSACAAFRGMRMQHGRMQHMAQQASAGIAGM